jgi:hypothetical protein
MTVPLLVHEPPFSCRMFPVMGSVRIAETFTLGTATLPGLMLMLTEGDWPLGKDTVLSAT